MMTEKFTSLPLWLLTLAIFTLLFFPYLFSNGMFMDGLLYATVARNLAQAPDFFADIFHLTYSETLLKEFYDQPPMAMWLQAVLFKLLGDSIYVERIYSFLTAITCMLLIILIWRTIYAGDDDGLEASWLPVFYWSIVPLVFWSFSNNMLENTLSVFSLAAVLFIFKGMTGRQYGYIYAGAAPCILAGFLSKGFVSMFPLASLGIYWLVKRDRPLSEALKVFAIFIVCTALIFAAFFAFESSRTYFENHLKAQVLPSLKGELNTVADNRLMVPRRLFKELLPLMAFSLIFLAVRSRAKIETGGAGKTEWFWIILLIAVSASFPIMLSYKQRGYYLVPSLPWYALAIAILAQPTVSALTQRLYANARAYKIVYRLALVFAGVALAYSLSQIGNYRRDADRIGDSQMIAATIAPQKILTVHKALAEDWNLFGYLARNHHVSLETSRLTDYFLAEKGSSEIPEGYALVDIPTTRYLIYRRQTDAQDASSYGQ
ncbi:MAG: hypothetical protein CVV41_20170 [Candidatus Riflebacteria bacterium HGW-Riflebacteria-1]|jgi:4-amino-4-deoxy-L-arabinose transferase-like glycosyltransferase|nr:MAG: hypothetical protein CVV41_20170 [Candidatus Riflebacteria bacterium HGW-Riflebacteria-1]